MNVGVGQRSDPQDGSLPLTAFRVMTILRMASVQVALVCVLQLVTMVRRGDMLSHAVLRYVDVVIGGIVSAALWPSSVSRSPCWYFGCCSPRLSRATSRPRGSRPSWTR